MYGRDGAANDRIFDPPKPACFVTRYRLDVGAHGFGAQYFEKPFDDISPTQRLAVKLLGHQTGDSRQVVKLAGAGKRGAH